MVIGESKPLPGQSAGGVARPRLAYALAMGGTDRTIRSTVGKRHLQSNGSETGINVQIHAQSVAELIGDQLRIDTGLTRKTGVRASHDLKGRPFQLDGIQPVLRRKFGQF